LLLGWLPGKRGRAIHDAMYYPIRASQWAGGMQRSGYILTKWQDNLSELAPETMKAIEDALPEATILNNVIGLPEKTKSNFIKNLKRRGVVGPETVRNYSKRYSTRNIAVSEVHEARMKYPDIGDVGDSAEEAAYSGRLWEDVRGTLEKSFEDYVDTVLTSPELKSKFYKNFVDDAINSVDKVGDMDTLMAYVRYLQDLSIDLPNTTSSVFTSIQHKASKATTKYERATIYEEGYNKALKYLDTMEEQTNRLHDFIKSNLGVADKKKANTLKNSLHLYMARVESLAATRRKSIARGSELLSQGVKPGSPSWYSAMDEIWQEYFKITDPTLYGLQQAASRDIDLMMGIKQPKIPIVNASGRALAPVDVAVLHHGTGNNLAYAIMNSEALMPKEYFVQSTISRAESMAKVAGVTRESLGFTDDAIAGVYDQIVYGLRSDPAVHNILTSRRIQLNSFASDLESIRINGSLGDDAVKALREYSDTYARNLENLDVYHITPEPSPAKPTAKIRKSNITMKGITVGDGIEAISARKLKDGSFQVTPSYTSHTSGAQRKVFSSQNEAWDYIHELYAKPSGVSPTTIGEGTSEWWNLKQKSMDKTMISYHQDFTDYSDLNALDAFARHMCPFWSYEAQRWFWLPRAFISHPGVMNMWGKYMDNSDYGYIHMPGTSLDINVMRGTVFKGGLSTLLRKDYPEYYDQAFPELFEGVDYLQRFGFYPNILYSFLTTEFGGKDPQLGQAMPAIIRTPLDLFVVAHPDSEAARQIQDRLFPDYFREYAQICQATHNATDDQVRRGITGVYVWGEKEKKGRGGREERKRKVVLF